MKTIPPKKDKIDERRNRFAQFSNDLDSPTSLVVVMGTRKPAKLPKKFVIPSKVPAKVGDMSTWLTDTPEVKNG